MLNARPTARFQAKKFIYAKTLQNTHFSQQYFFLLLNIIVNIEAKLKTDRFDGFSSIIETLLFTHRVLNEAVTSFLCSNIMQELS